MEIDDSCFRENNLTIIHLRLPKDVLKGHNLSGGHGLYRREDMGLPDEKVL